MELTAGAIELTKSQEGYVDHIYYDAVGVGTIGFGTTLGAGVVDPLPETCTETEATEWLLEYMNRSVVPPIVATGFDANANELGALADLGYNVGAGVFDEGTTMGDALRSKDRARISDAFMSYVYAGGEVLSDLVHRREADRALFDEAPPHIATYHYDWYPKAWQTGVKRYDDLRKEDHVRKLSKKEAAWMHARQVQCRAYAVSIALNAKVRHRLKGGKPSWAVDHRGWLYQELIHRAQGKYVRPV
jgi:lysozyme